MSRSKLLSGAALLALAGASSMGAILAQPVAQALQAERAARASQPTPLKNAPAPVDQQRRTNAVRRLVGGYSATRGDGRRAGPGWSNKHAQRVAKKARNVKRARSGSR